MDPTLAVALLSNLETLTMDTVAITPEDWAGSKLKPVKKLVEQDTGRPMFIYVNRLELIEHIRVNSNLHLKGTSCQDLLHT